MSRYVDTTRSPKSLTQDEQRRLLRVTGERRDGFRDHVIFSLALGTGLREHELLALNIGDVFEGSRCRRRFALRVFKRSNDDASIQEVVLPDAVRTKLERLVANRRRDGEELADDVIAGFSSPSQKFGMNRHRASSRFARCAGIYG